MVDYSASTVYDSATIVEDETIYDDNLTYVTTFYDSDSKKD
jgi:hypothetical protein